MKINCIHHTNRMKNQNYMINTIGTKKREAFHKIQSYLCKKKNLTNKDWKEITSAEFKPFMKSPQQLL